MQSITLFLLVYFLFALGLQEAKATPVPNNQMHKAKTLQPPASLQFTVLSPSEDQTKHQDYSVYIAAPMNVLDATRVKHIFVLQNKTGHSLTIEKIVPDHFTSVTITEDAQHQEFVRDSIRTPVYFPEHTFSFLVAATQTIHIETVLDTSYRQPGPFQEMLAVFVQGQSQPAAKLTVSGIILPAATLSPAVIDFGEVHAGTDTSRLLTVSLDSRLLAPRRRLEVTTTSPFITVVPLDEGAPASDDLNPSSLSSGSKPKFVQREFKLILSANASLGPFLCAASFSSNLPMASYLEHYGDLVTVKGMVVGEAVAQPDKIDFGIVKVGKPAQKNVTIILKSPLQSNNIQILCGIGKELEATIANDQGEILASSDNAQSTISLDKTLSSVTHLKMTVTFAPEKPALDIFSQIFITLGSQQIIIPISATAQ